MLLSSFVLVFGNIVSDGVQNEHLAPLGALVKGSEELINGLRVRVEDVGVRRRVRDLAEGGYGVRHHHRVRIRNEVAQKV